MRHCKHEHWTKWWWVASTGLYCVDCVKSLGRCARQWNNNEPTSWPFGQFDERMQVRNVKTPTTYNTYRTSRPRSRSGQWQCCHLSHIVPSSLNHTWKSVRIKIKFQYTIAMYVHWCAPHQPRQCSMKQGKHCIFDVSLCFHLAFYWPDHCHLFIYNDEYVYLPTVCVLMWVKYACAMYGIGTATPIRYSIVNCFYSYFIIFNRTIIKVHILTKCLHLLLVFNDR